MIRLSNLSKKYKKTLMAIFIASMTAGVSAAEVETVSVVAQRDVSTSLRDAIQQTSDRRSISSQQPSSGETVVMGIYDAVRRAVQWHPAIGEAIGILSQRQEQITVARAGYYPKIQGGLRSGYDNNYDERKSSQAFVLSVSQMIYDFGKVSNSVKAARAGVLVGQANVLLAIDDIARETSYAVIEIQRYQNLTRIAQDQLDGVGKILDLAEQRSTRGASTRSDVIQAQSRIEGARVTALQHEARLKRWQSHLASLTGGSGARAATDEFPEHFTYSCDQPDSDPMRVPEFLIAQARQSEAIALRDVARAENRPTISIDPSLTHYLDNNYKHGPNQERTQWGVFLNVNMPLYQGGSNRARARSAEFALQSANSAMEVARLNVEQGLFEALTQTATLERSLDVLSRRDTAISETRDLYRQQYLELGTRSLLDLLNAEQEIHQSRFDRQNTVSDLRRLNIDCLYNTGELRKGFGLDKKVVQGVEITP